MGFPAQRLELPRWARLAPALPLFFVATLVGLPVVSVAVAAGAGPGSAPNVEELLRVAQWSAIQATASTVVTLAVGLPLAFLMARFEFRHRSLLNALLLLPFLVPTVVTGLAVRNLFGDSWQPGFALLVATHAFVNLAVIVRLVAPVLAMVDDRYSWMAASLGAGRLQRLAVVWWPASRSAIATAAAIVWTFCFSSLGLALIVGGSWRTLDTLLLRQVSTLLDFRAASATAAMQFTVVSMVLFAASRLSSSGTRYLGKSRPGALRHELRFVPVLVALLLALPWFALVRLSFRGAAGFTFEWWRLLLNRDSAVDLAALPTVLWQSATVSIAAALLLVALLLALAISAVAGWSWLPRLTTLPLGISAVALGLGLVLAAGRWPLSELPRSALLPLAHAAIALPVVSALALPVVYSVDRRLLQIARSLGASRSRAFVTTYGSALFQASATAAAIAMAVSLGEYGAASFLTPTSAPTLPVEIMRLLSRPGAANLGAAAALSVLLGVLATLLFAVTDRLERGRR